jgi:hypothetical protein
LIFLLKKHFFNLKNKKKSTNYKPAEQYHGRERDLSRGDYYDHWLRLRSKHATAGGALAAR